MSVLRHWHPALPSDRLRDRPVGVRLAGRGIVLFRDSRGVVGALDDCCPHRRMKLSVGSVDGDRLQCAYHGWRYAADGQGESPGTPKLHAQACSFETIERHGAIWIRERGSDASFPVFDIEGHHPVTVLWRTAPAPIEIVVDNFTEVEHTPTTHALLGYEATRMTEVETRVEADTDRVRVFNAGPQKRIPKVLELLFGIRSGDRFVDDWTTWFSPVYCVYQQYWSDPATLEEHGLRWRIYVFFIPIDDVQTTIAVFAYIRKEASLQNRLARLRLARPILSWLVDREIQLDVAMMGNLADKRPGVEGMKLSRFDKTLGLHRDRIERLYRGKPPVVELGATPAATVH